MSFEGYYVRLCPSGHLWECDVYNEIDECFHCKQKYSWQDLVDETNGEGENPQFELLVPAKWGECDSCGYRKVAEPARWKPREEVP